ncbi:MAG: hypothetical protein AAFU03_10585 [Bacteroidota bacterium]
MATRTLSPLMKKYNAVKKAKTKYCAGKITKASLNKTVKSYVDAAVKKGQKKSEAKAKAGRIVRGKCSATARVSGTKRRRKTTKRKSTARRRR